jgi:hypothetical protein
MTVTTTVANVPKSTQLHIHKGLTRMSIKLSQENLYFLSEFISQRLTAVEFHAIRGVARSESTRFPLRFWSINSSMLVNSFVKTDYLGIIHEFFQTGFTSTDSKGSFYVDHEILTKKISFNHRQPNTVEDEDPVTVALTASGITRFRSTSNLSCTFKILIENFAQFEAIVSLVLLSDKPPNTHCKVITRKLS